MDNIEFGPEIRVDGVRPEWLDGEQQILMYDPDSHRRGGGDNASGWYGETIKFYGRDITRHETLIRLPANHPHYATSNLTTAADQLERMEALTRKLAALSWIDGTPYESVLEDFQDEAISIVALLPEEVDPDNLETVIQRAMGSGNDVSAYEIAQAVEEWQASRELAGEGK